MQDTTTQSYNLPSASLKGVRSESRWRLNNSVKRVFDIIISLLGLIILGPIFILIGIWIKRDTPGPVFYRGPRLGKDGKVFGILKFRTMREEQESYQGPRLTAQDDPRVTPLGHWLRETKINELPQLWNVINGDMSLVGPRPEDPELAKTWPDDIRKEVVSVRPGITSPASVLYHDEESRLSSSGLMDTYIGNILPSKLRLDQLYVRNRSFLFDLDVLFWTLLLAIPRVGGSAPPEEWLFWGPLSRLVRRYLSWFLIDLLVTFIAIGLSGAFWRSFGPLELGWLRAIMIATAFAILYSSVGALMGVHQISWSQAPLSDAIDLIPAVSLATLIALGLNFFATPSPILPFGLILMGAGVSFIGYVMVRYRSRLLNGLARRLIIARSGNFQAQERVLIVGGGETGQYMAWWLQNGRGAAGLRVIGIVDDDLYKQDMRIQGVKVLGRREDIPELVSNYDVGIILFAIHNIPEKERVRLVEICSKTPARLFPVPDILANLRAIANDNGISGEHDRVEILSQMRSINPEGHTIDKGEVLNWLEEVSQFIEDENITAAKEKIRNIRIVLDNHF